MTAVLSRSWVDICNTCAELVASRGLTLAILRGSAQNENVTYEKGGTKVKHKFKATEEIHLQVGRAERDKLSELGVDGERRQDAVIQRIAQFVAQAETSLDADWVPASFGPDSPATRLPIRKPSQRPE